MLKALAGGAVIWAAAAGASGPPAPASTTAVCIDVNGALLAANCRVEATRLEPRPDICSCARGVRAAASVCPATVKPPPESPAVARARREILARRGDLVGASFEGKPLCVERRPR
jgi:hypothetical protein